MWHCFSISFCNVTRFISVQCCIHFSPRSCFDDGRVGPLRKAFSSTSQRFSMGLDSVVANPCVKMMSHAPWTTLSQFEPNESWHCHLGICPCHQGKKNPLVEERGHPVYSGSQLSTINVDSSDLMTFFHCSRVQSLCSLANWSLFFRLVLLISGFLKATLPFSPDPLSSLHIVQVEILYFHY